MRKRKESKENTYDITLKIVILGDSSVVKTALTKKFCYNIFNPSERLTIGVDFHVKTIELDSRKIKLNLWDIGGQERFRFLLPTYCLGANGALFTYDITNSSTLKDVSDWTQIIREKAGDIPIFLAGVSLGLEEDRIVSSDEGLKVAKRYNLDGFIEVSPKTGKNVEELFNSIIRLALQTHSVKKKVKTKKIRPHREQKREIIDLLKETNKKLSLESKEEIKAMGLSEEEVKKRLNDLGVKLKDLDINLEDLDIRWDSFLGSINIDYTKETIVKFKGNYLIPYAHYLESKLQFLYLRVYERIDDKIDINYINNLERKLENSLKSIARKISLARIKDSRSPLLARKVFKVNDLLTLKLEHNKTFIYIKGERFIQCVRLSLQIPPQTRHLYEEIESIDEAAEVYKQSLWQNRIVEGPMAQPSRFQNTSITPEQEFWGHCSNIQTWAEHDYDTRLLHSNLSFPLLKALSDAGDPKAIAIFKEEIAIRLESGYPSVVNFLIEQRYLRYLDKDQLKILFENYADVDTKKSIRYRDRKYLEKRLYSIFTNLAKIKNTILIVSDEPDILNLAVKFLKLGNFDTITCSSTEEALRVIEERYNNIAMILLDPMMPRLITEKFEQSIKSDERYMDIEVAILPNVFKP